jgi:hypothetical protein
MFGLDLPVFTLITYIAAMLLIGFHKFQKPQRQDTLFFIVLFSLPLLYFWPKDFLSFLAAAIAIYNIILTVNYAGYKRFFKSLYVLFQVVAYFATYYLYLLNYSGTACTIIYLVFILYSANILQTKRWNESRIQEFYALLSQQQFLLRLYVVLSISFFDKNLFPVDELMIYSYSLAGFALLTLLVHTFFLQKAFDKKISYLFWTLFIITHAIISDGPTYFFLIVLTMALLVYDSISLEVLSPMGSLFKKMAWGCFGSPIFFFAIFIVKGNKNVSSWNELTWIFLLLIQGSLTWLKSEEKGPEETEPYWRRLSVHVVLTCILTLFGVLYL